MTYFTGRTTKKQGPTIPSSTLRRLLLVLAALYCQAAAGQSYAPADSRVIHLAIEDGLPNREVRRAVKDSSGVLWLSTAAGLVRHEGYGFTTLSAAGTGHHRKMTLGAEGLLYATVTRQQDSLEVFNPYTLEARGYSLAAMGMPGGKFVLNPGRYPIVRTDSAIYQLQPAPVLLHEPAGLPATATPIYADERGYIFHDKKENLVRYFTDGEAHQLPLPKGRRTWQLTFRPQTGILYAVGGYGLKAWNVSQGAPTRIALADVPRRPLNYLAYDESGRIVVGFVNTFDRRFRHLYLLEEGTWHDLSWVLGIEDRIISISGQDFSRQLRLSTYGGLQTIVFKEKDADLFNRYLYDSTVRKTRFGHVMRGFASDSSGNVYANKESYRGTWFRLRPGSAVLDTLPILDADSNRVQQLGCGTNLLTVGSYVYGHSCWRSQDSTSAHLYRYSTDTGTWKMYYLPTNDHIIRYLTKADDKGDLYLFTEATEDNEPGAIYRFRKDREQFERIDTAPGSVELSGYVRKVYFEPGQEIAYVGTTNGLYGYYPATGRLRSFPYPEPGISVMDILQQRDGSLLLGTLGNGLLKYDPQKGSAIKMGGTLGSNEARPADDYIILPSDDVAGLAALPDAGLLITTYNGLVLHADGNTRVFTDYEGLTNNEFNTTSLHYDDRSGRWFAGGVNGFVTFTTDILRRQVSPYHPVLLGYRELDENVGLEQRTPLPAEVREPLRVGASVAFFSLSFMLPDYLQLDRVRYETMLEGYDPAWRSPSATPSVGYTRLRPGKYTFRLRAIDGNGRVTQEARPMRIIVARPWYRQFWFYLLIAGAIIKIAAFIVYRRFRRLRKRFEVQQQIQELELRTLRLQMNPHFISNAMNAIREFVYNEDRVLAAGYITSFSRLMRLFLEASRKPFTTIANEVALLSYYIDLEQLRFPGRFTYTIEVGRNIEPEMDEVPSFVLQPIVENAIIHGLTRFETGGELTIRFYLDPENEEILCCEVTDNGIGYKSDNPKPPLSEYPSRGTQIISDRKALLASTENVRLTVETTDLHPGADRPGTRVLLTVAASPVA